jgi:hypothetical protein
MNDSAETLPAASGDDESAATSEVGAFDQPDAFRVGILGGKGVGKSYLFQALAYRTYAGTQAGALTYFLENDAIRLWRALERSARPEPLNIPRFLRDFTSWDRLPQTVLLTQCWYRLRLSYRTGLLGRTRSAIDVDFFDGSGEGLFEAAVEGENRAIWGAGFLAAKVLVFCLPLWVAFPGTRLSDEDWEERRSRLERFEQVVQNLLELRHRRGCSTPVDAVLALTMADDVRGGLPSLRERWILRYLAAPDRYLRELRTAGGLARYLANARRVSDLLHERFATTSEPFVAAIPQQLDLGRGAPWLIPLSAIEGARLEQVQRDPAEGTRRAIGLPVPVHVELPLLLTLCASSNALL